MFEYFPNNYWWSGHVLNSLGMGGEMTEIDPTCASLRELADRPLGDAERAAWASAWSALGRRIEALAAADAERGLRAGAARKYLRAANYLFIAEVMRPALDDDPEKLEIYDAAQRVFRAGLELGTHPVELVDVPFGDAVMPSIFVPAAGVDGPAPCMIHFEGRDDVKEVNYLRHREGLAHRGISMLIVDHPGSGEALRRGRLYARHDIEVAATAAVDYLETREDVDPDAIGIIGESMGGYYAPRSAAFEKRLKVCVVWGAIWDLPELMAGRADDLLEPTHWGILGPLPDADAVRTALSRFVLSDVVDQIECPLLVMHGENDRQTPLWIAERLYEAAVNAASRELRVFTSAEGGDEHIQIDVITQATDFIHDWLAQFFAGHRVAT
jgi:fermentation-respiration switch protein FrsA (DUF1100 family)